MKSRPTLRTIPGRGRPIGRRDQRPGSLDSIAAEFALLAQRRSRLMRQIELLERQHAAAHAQLGRVEQRMGVLSRRMALVPTLERAALEPEPPPPPPPPPPTTRGRIASAPPPPPAPSAPKAPPRRRVLLTY